MHVVVEFLDYLENFSGLSYNTLRLYKRDLIDFSNFVKTNLGDDFKIINLNADNLEYFFAQWLYQQGIKAEFVKLFQTMLCRPDICAAVPFPLTEVDGKKDVKLFERLNNSYETWRALSKEEKIKMCGKYGIDLEDYLDNLQWN
jgi:hypothetical protein